MLIIGNVIDLITLQRLDSEDIYKWIESPSIGFLIESIIGIPTMIAIDGTLISGIIYRYVKRKSSGEKIPRWEVAVNIFAGIYIVVITFYLVLEISNIFRLFLL